MFHTLVASRHLGPRLDSGFYDPEYLAADTAIRKFALKTMDSLRAPTAPLNKGVVKPRFQDSSVRMVRIQDFDDPFVNLDASATIDPLQMKEFRRSVCLPGDLLVALGGNPGRLGLLPRFPDGVTGVNINPHIVRVRFADGVNKAYVTAFLLSEIGRKLLARQMSGSVQASINLEDFRSVEVPFTATLAQRYIGDKVRQAERLHERARRLEAEFRNAIAVAVPSSATAGKTSRVETTDLGRNLNPGAYTPDRRAVRAAIRTACGRALDTLAEVESPTTDSYLATAPYLGLDAIDSATCGLKPSTVGLEVVAGTARLLREGPALSRLRPYLNKVTYIPPTLAGGVGSAELLLVRPKADVDGWFLYGVLKLETSIRQLNPVATGSTHPRVDREDVLDLLVPWRDDHDALGAKLRAAQSCYFASAELTAAATTLVEQLIDGRVTEADLVAAQKTLDGGDRSADCALLEALRQGDSSDAKPLIADVDALYALLDVQENQP